MCPVVWHGPGGVNARLSLAGMQLAVCELPPDEQPQALQVMMSVLRRRAPALRLLELDFESCLFAHQLSVAITSEELLACLAAAPLTSLDLRGGVAASLQLLASKHWASLSELIWSLRQEGGAVDWTAPAASLARLAGLRSLNLSLQSSTLSDSLAAAIEQLRGLQSLSISCRSERPDADQVEQQQGQGEGEGAVLDVALELGFLGGSASSLSFFYLGLHGEAGGQITVNLHPTTAVQLTALTRVSMWASDKSASVDGLQHLPGLRQLQLKGVAAEPVGRSGGVWETQSLQCLWLEKSEMWGPGASFKPDVCPILGMTLRECTLPAGG